MNLLLLAPHPVRSVSDRARPLHANELWLNRRAGAEEQANQAECMSRNVKLIMLTLLWISASSISRASRRG